MDKIKVGEKQPVKCPKCKDFLGYEYHDTYRVSIPAELKEGQVALGTLVRKSSEAYCTECGSLLPFRLNREIKENVKFIIDLNRVEL